MATMALQACVCLSLISCTPDSSPPQGPADESNAEQANVDDPAEQEGVYATQGPIALTVQDLQRAVSWREWVTGQRVEDAYGPDWAADEALIRRLTSNLFDEALVERDAAAWNLEVTDEELEIAIRSIPSAVAILQLPAPARAGALEEIGLTWDDVERAARQAVLISKWHDHRIDSLTEERPSNRLFQSQQPRPARDRRRSERAPTGDDRRGIGRAQ